MECICGLGADQGSLLQPVLKTRSAAAGLFVCLLGAFQSPSLVTWTEGGGGKALGSSF